MEALLTGLRAVAEPTRLRLIALSAAAELTVSELTLILGQSQPRVSRHLKLLCEAGLLDRFREGTWAFYRVSRRGPGAELAQHLLSLLPSDDPTLTLDRERLAAVQRTRAAAAANYFSANAAEWDRIRSLHVPERDVEAAILDRLDLAMEDVLDIGTGTGRLLGLLAPRAARGIGVDINRDMLAVARANLEQAGLANASVRQADLYQLPFPGAGFDAVTLHQVLHFLDDPARALAEAARVLRPGGRIVIVDFLPHEREELRERFTHRRLGFSDDEIAGWCESLGLSFDPPTHLAGDPLTVAIWSATRLDGARDRLPSPSPVMPTASTEAA